MNSRKPLSVRDGHWVFRDYTTKPARLIRLCRTEEADWKTTSKGKRKRTEQERSFFLERLKEEKVQEIQARSKARIEDLFRDWLDLARSTRSPRTAESYESTARYYLDAVGDHPGDAYDGRKQKIFVDALRFRGLADHSIQAHLRQLKACFRHGERVGLIERAPLVEPLRVADREITAFSQDDLDRIGRHLENRLKTGPPFRRRFYLNHIRGHMMLSWTGIRAGELCHLKLQEIHLEDRLITIVPDGSDWAPKSRRVDRVPMSVVLQRFLITDINERPDRDVYYLDAGTGSPAYPKRDQLTQAWKRILGRVGIEGVKPIHGYRASLATRLIRAGVGIVEVQKILRHQQIQTTRQYVDSIHLDLHKAVDVL